ncbi:restriction endonuclease subunit S [Scrofimicrobium sp. R131]|uniref:Restriction endonuclease subunit S n=1 Tax=Scrofimicrobium appendicitidis TaxID=3079930 RepID=A0AAU7V747_9ACTO
MIADRLRAAILQAAISGRLTDQRPEDGTATELLEQIAAERDALIKEKKLKKAKLLPPITGEDRQFVIPPSWVWTRVGEVARYAQRGKSPIYADVSPYSAVSQKCVRWSGFDSTFARPYAPKAFEALPQERILSAGDILWNSTGTGTVGRSTVLPDSGDYSAMAADSHVTVIRTFRKVLPRFVDVFISSPHIQQNMDDLTSGTTKQQELNLGTILELPLPLPPLAEQERIIAKLDEVLPLIDQLAELEREREHLDREFAKAIERAILQAAISGKLTKQLPEDGTATELLETIKNERQQLEQEGKIKKQQPLPPVDKTDEPFELPDTWEWVRLGFAAISSPPVKAVDSDVIGFLSMANIEDGISGRIHPVVRSWREVKTGYTKFGEGDVVIAKITPCFQNRKSAVIRNLGSVSGAGTTELHVLRPGTRVEADYLLSFLKSEYVQAGLVPQMTGTAGQKRVPLEAVKRLPFPLPTPSEQQRIVSKLDCVLPLVREIGELVS